MTVNQYHHYALLISLKINLNLSWRNLHVSFHVKKRHKKLNIENWNSQQILIILREKDNEYWKVNMNSFTDRFLASLNSKLFFTYFVFKPWSLLFWVFCFFPTHSRPVSKHYHPQKQNEGFWSDVCCYDDNDVLPNVLLYFL